MKGTTASEYFSSTVIINCLWHVSSDVFQSGQVTKKPPCVTLAGYKST
ncbi:hypothetical protein [Lentilactobacillus raoultii]|nr:hypothetical protein [Lentilactobacillus raoultii]